MGVDFYLCENCEECRCCFGHCFICENPAVCLDCIENQKYNHYLYNVIYCKNEDDEYGNLKYLYICDYCLTQTEDELNKIKWLDEKIKNIVLQFDLSLILKKQTETRERLEEKLVELSKLFNETEEKIKKRSRPKVS